MRRLSMQNHSSVFIIEGGSQVWGRFETTQESGTVVVEVDGGANSGLDR